jgi:hypothetical protein
MLLVPDEGFFILKKRWETLSQGRPHVFVCNKKGKKYTYLGKGLYETSYNDKCNKKRNTESLTSIFVYNFKNGYVFLLSLIVILLLNFTSCVSFQNGVLMIDTPENIKNDKIIKNVILPYIAKALDYNDPDGTDDLNKKVLFRRIPTVNNMNYDDVVNCQDYSLLFYALCKYHKIPVKAIGNFRYKSVSAHAYNQINYGFGTPVDIEPQSGEDTVYVAGLLAMHGMTGKEGGIRFQINTDPNDREFDPYNWGDNEQSKGWWQPNLEILNYVIANGELPFSQWATLNIFSHPPLKDFEWEDDPYNIKHDGLSVSQWFREASGTAKVEGKLLTYFLYDTYYKNGGSIEELYQAFFDYVEKDGWVIDYENFEVYDPNTGLAESVKSIMRSRNYDVSFTLIQDEIGAFDHEWAYCIVNNYNKDTGVYSTVMYYIDRYYDRNGFIIK